MVNDLMKYRLNKSRDDLKSSEILFNQKLFAQSLNRSYYCIFHAVKALLALDCFDSRKHSGIIAFFNENYIKKNKIDIELSKILMDAQKIRTKSDYDDFYVATEKTALIQYENAKKFLIDIENFLINSGQDI
ncbi:MAG: HEPN domain-containing protein [Candidatus Absconditabacterales bacterium]|nr:HEPN domain-containing protein [Candidatus Absconditabacterales bacterium]